LPRKREIFIEPPRLTSEFIRQEAEKFRQKYVTPPDALPVPIIQIVELRLKLEIVPIIGLMEIDIDGFLTSDLKRSVSTPIFTKIPEKKIGCVSP